jgi:hypothetical protein
MKSLTIIGRRWFNDREGNTYYSGRALVDGKEVASEKFAYGYGDQYVYELWVDVVKALELDVEWYGSGGCEGASRWCRRNDVAFTYEAADVARKRDL